MLAATQMKIHYSGELTIKVKINVIHRDREVFK